MRTGGARCSHGEGYKRKNTTLLKHTLSAAPETEASIGDELRDGHASTDAAQALTEAVNEQVQQQLAHREFFGEPKKHRKKLKPAIGAFLADLLSAEGNWVYRSLKTDGFTGAPVGARVFISLQDAMRELGLVEHRQGVAERWVRFDEHGPPLASRRRAARYRPTKKLIALAADQTTS